MNLVMLSVQGCRRVRQKAYRPLDDYFVKHSTHSTAESNTLIGYITLAMDSNRSTLELNSLYPRFPLKLNQFYSGYMFDTC